MSSSFGYNTKSIVGDIDTINTDINFYNPDELSKILQLKEVTKNSILVASNRYIQKFKQEKNNRLMKFFRKFKQN